MSEETQGGGVDVPKVGPVPKKAVIVVGSVAAAYVGWRWYQSRQASAAAASTDTTGTDPSFQDPGTLPSVAGALYDPTTGQYYGNPSGGVGSVSDYGFHGTTNAEWTQYAANQLVQSDTWSYTDIVSALGQYLANRPLSAVQVQIVQAAIAVAGYPPVGSFSIIPGGSTSITIAPTGLQVTGQTSTSVALSWLPVAGAAGYHVDGHGHTVDATGTSATLSGLTPSTAYTITVAAKSSGGALGPASDPVTAHTSAASSTPPPPGKPPVKGKPVPPSLPANRYPKRKSWHIVVARETYTSIAHKYAPTFSAEELWAYQSNAASGHSPGAAAKLHQQGDNELHLGQSIAIPYPK